MMCAGYDIMDGFRSPFASKSSGKVPSGKMMSFSDALDGAGDGRRGKR